MPKHLNTPQKSEIRGVRKWLAYCADKELSPSRASQEKLAECFEVSRDQVRNAEKSTRSRRTFGKDEPRGRKRKNSTEQLKPADGAIRTNASAGREFEHGEPRHEADIDSPATARQLMLSDVRIKNIGVFVPSRLAHLNDKQFYDYFDTPAFEEAGSLHGDRSLGQSVALQGSQESASHVEWCALCRAAGHHERVCLLRRDEQPETGSLPTGNIDVL